MAEERNTHGAVRVRMSTLPFYKAMKTVQENTGLGTDELLLNNVGFRAIPSRCVCGQEYSAFDIVIGAVQQKEHDWDFFREALVGETSDFFCRKMDLKCHCCGVNSTDVRVLYRYVAAKVMGWGY